MKIGIVIGRFFPGAWGGAEVQARKVAGLLAENHEVTVFARQEQELPPVETEEGYTVIRTRTVGFPVVRLLVDVFRTYRTISRRASSLEVLLCFQTINSGVIGSYCKNKLGIPFVVWIRGQEEYRWGARIERRALVPRVLRSADKVLVQSEHIKEELKAAMEEMWADNDLSALSSKLRIIPTMVEAGQTAPGPKGPVLFVGRLLKVKGVELLLEAMRYVDGARLVIIGDGPLREKLERAARGLPVEFTGILPHEEVRRRMSQAAVLVQPSLAEGMPNTVLEAMTHGVPVVATAVAGLRDLIVDGENGFLIDRRDPKLMGERIAALLADHELWSRISKACPETARSYSPEVVIPKLEETLRDVIRESGEWKRL